MSPNRPAPGGIRGRRRCNVEHEHPGAEPQQQLAVHGQLGADAPRSGGAGAAGTQRAPAGHQQIDEGTIRLVLDWLASTIEHKTETMATTEMAHVSEQLDDPMVRARRDDAATAALGGITRTRARIE